MICKVKKIDGQPADRVTPLSSAPAVARPSPAIPRRRYVPSVKMYGGCDTMYMMNPSLGGRNPQGENVRRMLYDEPVVGGRNPRRNPRYSNTKTGGEVC